MSFDPAPRERLEEAEALALALQRGEVDAFVMGKTEEEKRVILLSEAYEGYRSLVDEMPQGAVTLSSAGHVLHANRAFAILLGDSDVEPLRTHLDEYLAEVDREAVHVWRGRAAAGDGTAASMRRHDGTELRVRLRVVAAREALMTLLVVAEENVREDAEARDTVDAIRQGGVDAFVVGGEQVVLLDSAQTPYRVLVERMREGAVTAREDGTIVYVNDRFAAMLTTVPDRLLGSNLVDHVDPLDQASLRSFLARAAASQIEVRLRAEDRSRRSVVMRMTPLGAHRLLLVADVTESKRHAASEELNRRFLGLLAQEFSDLIGPITAAVRTLRALHGDAPSTQALDTIRRHTQRLETLVDDLRRINPKE